MNKGAEKYYILTIIVLALGLAVTAVYLSLLPDSIPAHYNFAGEVDRWGSKYEQLFLPLFTMVYCPLFLLWAKKGDRTNEKVLAITAFSQALLFVGMHWYFCQKALNIADGDASSINTGDLTRWLLIAMGLLLVVMGNIMPKVKRNGFLGLRSKWSMANDAVWQKCQRFGGFSAAVLGLLMIVCGFFVGGAAALVVLLLMGPVWGLICLVASKRIYEKEMG